MANALATPASHASGWTLGEAEKFCRDLAQSHYENFTVGSFFIPKSIRQHMYNVYAFCRWSDDLGDESENPTAALRKLEDWEKQLHNCYDGKATHPIFVALQRTIREFDIPKTPFWNLIQAFKQDQVNPRYQTFQDVLGYCKNSANPVGHLVLYLFNYRDAERQALSDKTCTALQLANFWQDVHRDLKIGRIYVPLEDLKRFNVKEEDFRKNRATPQFKQLLRFQVERTRVLFLEGRLLVGKVEGLLKVDLEAFTQGGLAVLQGIEKINFDVLATRPTVSRLSKLKILFRSARHLVPL